MSNRLSGIIRRFLEPGGVPILFIIGTILLGLLSNAFYDWLKNSLGGALLVAAMAMAVFLLIILAYSFYYLAKRIVLRRRPELKVKVPKGKVNPHKGLIVLVSQGKLNQIPATAAIKYHYDANGKLEHCWLVASAKPQQEPQQERKPGQEPFQSSFRNAQELRARYEAELATAKVRIIEDAEDPEEVFKVVKAIYEEAEELGLEAGEIVADFTGGTKSMTAGMVLACTSLNRDLEFMKPLGYLPDGRADPKAGSEPRFVDISFFIPTLER